MSKKLEKRHQLDRKNLASIYLDMKDFVIRAGYDHEIDWQSDLNFETVTETDFLRETAWVILTTGFRESVVRASFESISEAFLNWCSAKRIDTRRDVCRQRAISIFSNRRKIEAIVEIARTVANQGIRQVKEMIQARGVGYLQELPYIGPTTSYHLAKNLGIQVVKPDRHLKRMALLTGHASPMEMCCRVAETVGDSPAVVDLVFWRYATLNKKYQEELETLVKDSVWGS